MVKFNSLDLETFGNERIIPYCLCTVYEGKCYVFYGLNCIEKWSKWVFSFCKNNSFFYIHNLNFDGNIILNFLPEKYFVDSTSTVLKRGDFYCLSISDGFKKIKMICSVKLFPMSLDELARLFNVGSKKDMDHSEVTEDNISDVQFKIKVIKYCSNDAILVTRIVEKINISVSNFIKISDVYSISGLALNIYKKNFNYFKLIFNQTIEFDEMIRPGYYGGRCEVFGNKEEDEVSYHFDFSGMYTNRLTEKYPHGSYYFKKNVEKIKAFGFYFVEVYSDLELPILPYRNKKTGKLLFPNGNFSGLYWGEELLLFIENGGRIKKILYGIEFEKEDYIFNDFAVTCDKKRKNSIWEKTLWKLIPNSFIGRLGLKYDEEETIIVDDEKYDPREYDVICDKKINNKWIVRVKKQIKEVKNSNVSYPAIITSKARILWWKSANEVTKNKGRLLYCDTDSIFAAFPKNENPLGKTHGDVYWDPKKIDTKLDDSCFATSKVYCIVYGDKKIFKIKGISKKYIKDFDVNKFKKYFEENKSNIFKTLIFEKKKMNIQIKELNKLIDFSSYDKRIFNDKKTYTKPLKIDE